MRNKCYVWWKKGWHLFRTKTRSTFCPLNKVPTANKEVNFPLRYWFDIDTNFGVILLNGLVSWLCCLFVCFSFLFVSPLSVLFSLVLFIFFFLVFYACLLGCLFVLCLFVLCLFVCNCTRGVRLRWKSILRQNHCSLSLLIFTFN